MDMLTKPMTESDREADYLHFCVRVRTFTGLDLTAYKREQMERRLRAMADRVGAASLCDFFERIADDPQALTQFMDRVTINVSEFFRNREKFEQLQQEVLPELLSARRPLSIWSAGCSIGAEIYTVNILLCQVTRGIQHRLLATDIDNRSLEHARRGIYTGDELREVPPAVKKQFFTSVEGGYQIIPEVRQGVVFQHGDLLRDRFPERVDLILCRNVVIYFSDETKDRLYRRFYAALNPGGYLLVGNTERINNAQEIGFTVPKPFFYRKHE